MTVPEPGREAMAEGIVERVVFIDGNGFTVLLLGTGADEPLKASGGVPPGRPAGGSLCLTGSWRHHPTHGMQFAATDCTHALPASLYAMRRHLASGLIKASVPNSPTPSSPSSAPPTHTGPGTRPGRTIRSAPADTPASSRHGRSTRTSAT
ncbi:hypothetical protein GXW82_44175 [Streptacidiphilus sp. 4-A2]|nr:hypothetical protein [Streptacidiphilus sp. 4-A2]